MHGLQLGEDAVEPVVGALGVGHDEEVVLGDDAIGQAHLVEQQFQARLEPDALEVELDLVLRGHLLPAERRQVEDDRSSQGLAQVSADVLERGRLAEGHDERPEHGVLDRDGGAFDPCRLGDPGLARRGLRGRRPRAPLLGARGQARRGDQAGGDDEEDQTRT